MNNRESVIGGVHRLANGRMYRLLDHGEFHSGEYPTGGIHISAWDPRINQGAGGWTYIDNSPDSSCALGFLRSAARLPVIPSTAATVLP